MKINKLVRKNILALKPYTSARDLYSEGILLDANENSYGSVLGAPGGINRYPDPHQKALREKMRAYLGINPANIIFGNGSDELIDLLIRIFCEPGKDSVLINEPTYGMYRVAADINGVNVITSRNGAPGEYEPDAKTVKGNAEASTKIIFLCSPNNPTGRLIPLEVISEICEANNSMVIVDEAYIDFCREHSAVQLINQYPNLVVLRTFSKAWGCAGIRAGYCIADPFVIDLLRKVKAPYNINKLTEQAILAAIDNSKKMEEYVGLINSEREYLYGELKTIKGVEPLNGAKANFILFRVKDRSYVRNYLASKGVVIRERHFPGLLENGLRITIGIRKENEKFLALLKEVLCTKR